MRAADQPHPVKRQAAKEWLSRLWEDGSGSISWQVLHEFYVSVRRAWFWADEAQLSYWDGLILSAAERSGSVWLLSEDFQEGRSYAGVTILNPFSADSERRLLDRLE